MKRTRNKSHATLAAVASLGDILWPSYSQYTDWMEDSSAPEGLNPRTVLRRGFEYYHDSTRTLLGRRGPSNAVHSPCRRNLTKIEVSVNREVHYYSFPTQEGPFVAAGGNAEEFFLTPNEIQWGFVPNRPSDQASTVITKCIRVGSGWGEGAPMHADFALEGEAEDEDTESRANVDIYYVDPKITCATGKTSFHVPPEVANTSANIVLTECTIEGEDDIPVVCETLAYLAFPTYQLELTSTEDFTPAYLSNTDRDLTKPPIRIHPDWILAGWSVDRAGSIPASRGASTLMINAMRDTLDFPYSDATYVGPSAYQTHAINLGLSLIPFSTLEAPPDVSERPAVLLDASQQVTVWSCSLHSRTSILGAVIVIAGCVAVILRSVVCLISRSESLGLTQLLVGTAKEPSAERLNDERSDKEYARQRVLLRVDEREEWSVFDFL